MGKIFYVGRNGMEYPEQRDAERSVEAGGGGGCIGKRIIGDTTFVPLAPPIIPLEPEVHTAVPTMQEAGVSVPKESVQTVNLRPIAQKDVLIEDSGDTKVVPEKNEPVIANKEQTPISADKYAEFSDAEIRAIAKEAKIPHYQVYGRTKLIAKLLGQ